MTSITLDGAPDPYPDSEGYDSALAVAADTYRALHERVRGQSSDQGGQLPPHAPVPEIRRAFDSSLRLAVDLGGIVAWWVPEPAASVLAQPGGEDPSMLHVTLLALPHEADPDTASRAVREAVRRVARRAPLLSGTVGGGAGRFQTDEGPVVWAAVDVPGLAELRGGIVDELAKSGIRPLQTHGYSPHITLRYGSVDVPDVQATPVTVGALSVAYGTERWDYPLAQAPHLRPSLPALRASDDDAVAYGRMLQSIFRQGVRDSRFRLAVVRNDGDGTDPITLSLDD